MKTNNNHRNREIYISVDIEADGHIPGRNSMLSIGMSAFTLEKELLSTFGRNLIELPGAVQDADTMEFWKANPKAWEECRKNPIDPKIAMTEAATWLNHLYKTHKRPLTLLAYPGGYDFQFVNWYLHYFVNDNPCGWSVFCIKSYIAAVLACDFRDSAKRNFPKRWFEKDLPHTHIALLDSIEQGALSVNVLREVRGLPPVQGIINLDKTFDFSSFK